MSPLGRALLQLCNEDLRVNVSAVQVWFPTLTYGQIEHYALRLGMSVSHA